MPNGGTSRSWVLTSFWCRLGTACGHPCGSTDTLTCVHQPHPGAHTGARVCVLPAWGAGRGGHLTAENTGGFLSSMVLSAFPSPCHKHVLGTQPQEPALKPGPTRTVLATQSVSNSIRLPGGPEAKLSTSGNVASHGAAGLGPHLALKN